MPLAARAPFHERTVTEDVCEGFEVRADKGPVNLDAGYYGHHESVSAPNGVNLNASRIDAPSHRQTAATATAAIVTPKLDVFIPAHCFIAPEYEHRYLFDNFRSLYRQYRKTPEYKQKQKEKKQKAKEKSRLLGQKKDHSLKSTCDP